MFRAIMYYISYCREVYVSAVVQNGIMSRARCVCTSYLVCKQLGEIITMLFVVNVMIFTNT